MCGTCNYKNFEVVNINGKQFLEKQLGSGSLLIRCDLTGKIINWQLKMKTTVNMFCIGVLLVDINCFKNYILSGGKR